MSANSTRWGRLISLTNEGEGFDLCGERNSFGREDGNTYVLADERISRVHFVIERRSEGLTLNDRSRNGTFLNGKLVGNQASTTLKNGDKVTLLYATTEQMLDDSSQGKDVNKYAFEFVDYTEVDDPASAKFSSEAFNRKYTLMKELGRGTSGVVYLAEEKGKGNKVAVKVIPRKHFGAKSNAASDPILRELHIFQQLDHPNVAKIFEAFRTQKEYRIVMEFIDGGNMFSFIESDKTSSEENIRNLMRQIFSAVSYLHQKGIAHRDLKPENILICQRQGSDVAKLTDFGISKIFSANMVMKTNIGTPVYQAPEILLVQMAQRSSYNEKVDLWSLGVVLFLTCSCECPFDHDIDTGIITNPQQLLEGRFTFNAEIWTSFSEGVKDLIRGLLQPNPDLRLSCEQALAHPWISRKLPPRILKRSVTFIRPRTNPQMCSDETLPILDNGANAEAKDKQAEQNPPDNFILATPTKQENSSTANIGRKVAEEEHTQPQSLTPSRHTRSKSRSPSPKSTPKTRSSQEKRETPNIERRLSPRAKRSKMGS